MTRHNYKYGAYFVSSFSFLLQFLLIKDQSNGADQSNLFHSNLL